MLWWYEGICCGLIKIFLPKRFCEISKNIISQRERNRKKSLLNSLHTCNSKPVMARPVWLLFGETIYHNYPKYLDTSTPYRTYSKIWTSTIYYPMLCLKIAGWVANSVDPEEITHFAASHLGLHCLLRPVCLNTYDKYGTIIILSITSPNCLPYLS